MTNQLTLIEIKKTSDNNSITVELLKNVHQKTYFPNNLKIGSLGNKKVLEKSQIGWGQMAVPSLRSRNQSLVIGVRYYTKAELKVC